MSAITMMKKSPISCFKNVTVAILIMACLVLQVVDLVCAEKAKEAAASCIDTERQALVQFKAAIVDYYGMLSTWKTDDDDDDCCQWDRVTCNNLTDHVQRLHLHGSVDEDEPYLRGMIHTSLVELQQLQYLNLSFNRFRYINIPEFFGSMRNLRYLDLSSCDFFGKVPSQFGSLSHLKYLNLRRNGLEGSIPYQLGNLSKLQYLDLTENQLQGTIPSQLGNLTSLQELYLGPFSGALKLDGGSEWLSSLTSLTHLDLSQVLNLNNSHTWLQMIGKLPKLKELALYHCGLSDHFILSLNPSKFNFSTSLSVLDLSGNSFTSFKIFQWVSNIGPNLVELDLSGNFLESNGSSHFGLVMNSLERLYLFDNRLKGVDLIFFMNICTLHSLDLKINNLTEDLPSILHNLSVGCAKHSLEELYLSDNQITDTLSDLSIFSSLKILDLSQNRLSGKIPEETKLPPKLESLEIRSNSLEGGIPKSFGNTCTLSSLDFSNNNLSEELRAIIQNLSGCIRYSLKELNLAKNKINGTLSDFSLFPSLRDLFIYENKLNGKIPEDIRFPPQLEYLDIGSNCLDGVISESRLANVSKLRSLDLSHNSVALVFSQNWVPPFQLESIRMRSCQLGPHFPRWLQTQNHLEDIDISNAGISDIVPEWFWTKLEKLRLQGPSSLSFNISHNNLKGTIPNLPLIMNGDYSLTLTLASNQFKGPIPAFLRGASQLDLSRNKFSDYYSFVCSNGTNEILSYIDLSNNQLSGQIPDCWSHFKSLAYLDLSHNNFSGKIPASMGSLLELQALILRNNNLSEEIPSSMQSCSKLVMLDVQENNLSGHIPSWIGSRLQELQVLSLQRNHFFGSLPLQLCYLKKVQVMDLSLNNLSGQVPKCIQNLTSMAQKTSSSSDYSSYHYYVIRSHFGIMENDFDLNAFLMWKDVEQMFMGHELSLLKSIDLSSNQLSGEIPAEIEDLLGLVSLNLSRNNLTGKIPSNIGRLTSLEFLDLSRNQLSGPIPSSLTQIDRLPILDVSHNHLSGRIPTSTQLQSFDASRYEDNLDLCGEPLQKLCIEGEPPQEPTIKSHEEEHTVAFANAFYMSMGVGFAVGFWGIFGSILVKRSWRHAYFRFLNNLTDDIYVIIAVKVAKYKRWLRG